MKKEVKVISYMKDSLSSPFFARTFQDAWENAEATTRAKGRGSIAPT